MARPDRLLRLLQVLRACPPPVTAARLAAETGVSRRTLYRDIDTLRAGGALIDGAAGLGYRLTEDPALPPQTFTRLEIEALVLGLGEAARMGDPALAAAAEAALAKVVATLPERLQRQAAHAASQIRRLGGRAPPPVDLSILREACWAERAVDLTYRDAGGVQTARRIWPLSIVYLDSALMLLAHCRLRGDYRRFMIARMEALAPTEESFRPHRVPMLREFVVQMQASR